MPRGPKKHLKRLNAPSHWMLDKLGGIFVRSRSLRTALRRAAEPRWLTPFCMRAGPQAVARPTQAAGVLAAHHSVAQPSQVRPPPRAPVHPDLPAASAQRPNQLTAAANGSLARSAQVCADGSGGDGHPDAAAREGGRQGAYGRDLPRRLHGRGGDRQDRRAVQAHLRRQGAPPACRAVPPPLPPGWAQHHPSVPTFEQHELNHL